MNRFSTARGNAPAPVTVTGSASFRSARAESRRFSAAVVFFAVGKAAVPPPVPPVPLPCPLCVGLTGQAMTARRKEQAVCARYSAVRCLLCR